jgi:hypothetical protein
MTANQRPRRAASWGDGTQRAAWMCNVDLNTETIVAAVGVPRVARIVGPTKVEGGQPGHRMGRCVAGACAQTPMRIWINGADASHEATCHEGPSLKH